MLADSDVVADIGVIENMEEGIAATGGLALAGGS